MRARRPIRPGKTPLPVDRDDSANRRSGAPRELQAVGAVAQAVHVAAEGGELGEAPVEVGGLGFEELDDVLARAAGSWSRAAITSRISASVRLAAAWAASTNCRQGHGAFVVVAVAVAPVSRRDARLR